MVFGNRQYHVRLDGRNQVILRNLRRSIHLLTAHIILPRERLPRIQGTNPLSPNIKHKANTTCNEPEQIEIDCTTDSVGPKIILQNTNIG